MELILDKRHYSVIEYKIDNCLQRLMDKWGGEDRKLLTVKIRGEPFKDYYKSLTLIDKKRDCIITAEDVGVTYTGYTGEDVYSMVVAWRILAETPKTEVKFVEQSDDLQEREDKS